MPDILIRVVHVANGEVHPFQTTRLWKFRRCPYERGLYTILVKTTGAAANIEHEVKIGTTEVVQRSDTTVGGTDGVMPTPAGANSAPAHQFYAQYNDEIDLALFETAAATPVSMVWANVEPA